MSDNPVMAYMQRLPGGTCFAHGTYEGMQCPHPYDECLKIIMRDGPKRDWPTPAVPTETIEELKAIISELERELDWYNKHCIAVIDDTVPPDEEGRLATRTTYSRATVTEAVNQRAVDALKRAEAAEAALHAACDELDRLIAKYVCWNSACNDESHMQIKAKAAEIRGLK